MDLSIWFWDETLLRNSHKSYRIGMNSFHFDADNDGYIWNAEVM